MSEYPVSNPSNAEKDLKSTRRQTVLVVDDAPANIDLLVGSLKEEYNVKAATRGEKALQIVRSDHPPDMILLDIMMPGMDGYEVCRQLKEDFTTRHIPIIFITAKIGIEDEIRGFALGAVDYVTKPISPPVVQARVRAQLALYDQNQVLDRKVKEQTAQLHATRLRIIQRLGRAAEYKDNETGLHVIRMSHYSHVLGRAVGMNEQEAELLLNASPMHDIGKIGIPDRVLQKPGKLNPDEWVVMQTHCQIGADILGDAGDSELLDMARIVALTHHEKWDGTGYPRGLAAEAIPRVGRIVAVADVFDALTSVRPYKAAWPVEQAVALLRQEAGTHFDPQLVPLFIEALPDILDIKARHAEVQGQ
ncbi:response regulator [Thiocystis violascens]|uniref:Response regulator containing a CheY-like receiver domain and an HD-GYP domain n=1 Tax=Thiocystis violascens (strain ATCC 17096 / DSM 198 / 6111) TaxID=765911 RepID=I3Y8A8_THIV6|nr:two-component system response regulator [Thiocystis violascens]AFL73226.1 response regulator containing a CheY-like receiver domain and an HD-GYP domain [Thiocystis violascens DSM 198]